MNAVRVLMRRLSAVAHARALDRDLDAEIASHLEEAIDEHIARGLTAEEARLAALRSFGGVLQTRERHRDLRSLAWLDDLRQDLRQTRRALVKNPGVALVAVATLALGIGANTTIFTLLDAVVFKPLPVPAARELVTFFENGPEGTPDPAGGSGRYLRFSYPRFERLESALGSDGSIAAVTRSALFTVQLPGGDEPRFLYAQMVSGRYFETLGVSAARGRTLTVDDVRRDRASTVAVISDGFWKRMLGGADTAIGQSLIVNGLAVTVVGIAPAGFVGMWTDRDADVWLPLTLQHALRYDNNSSGYGRIDATRPWFDQDLVAWLNLVARVPDAARARAVARLQGANRDGVAALAETLANSKNRTDMLAHTLAVEPFARGFSGLRAQFSDALFVLAAMVAMVLLVTCANIANLLLARAAGHAREMGVRLSLGATTGRLVRQCLTESFTIAALGGGAGVLLGRWGSEFLAHQVLATSGELPQVFAVDLRVLAFAAALSVATAIGFGLAPALGAVRAGRSAALGGSQRQAVGHATPKGMRSLVVIQLALSVVVVFAAMLLGRTLINFMRIAPGFAADRLVTASIDPVDSGYQQAQIPAFSRRLVEAARAVPGVRAAAISRCGLIAGCSSSAGFHVEGAPDSVSLYENWITPGYFETVGIPVVAGREFTDREGDRGAKVAIVNESIAHRYFPGVNPIGRRLGSSALDIEIVGVVRDARTQSLHEPPVPTVYQPMDQRSTDPHTSPTNLDVRVDGDPRAAVAALRAAIRRSEPKLLVNDVGLMTARLDRDLRRERVVAYLAATFGALTLLLASLGLYGVLAYSVTRRTQEIGVRMALGARRKEVMSLVLGQSARLAIVGMALGVAGFAAAARSLGGMLFGVTPLDASTFVAVALTFAAVTALASCLPARRATRVDPIVALRCD